MVGTAASFPVVTCLSELVMAGSTAAVGLLLSLIVSHGVAFLVVPEQRHSDDRCAIEY